MRITKREIIGISILLAVSLVYISDQLLYQPLKVNKTRLANERAQIIRQLEKIDAQQSRDQNMLILEPEIKREYQKMITKIPVEPMISDTVRFLECGAAQAKVAVAAFVIQDMRSQPKVTGENDHQEGRNGALTPEKLQVIARGSRYQLLCFLQQIDNSPRLMIIEDISWSVDVPKGEFMPPRLGSYGTGEAENPADTMNEGQTETMTIGLVIYCLTAKQTPSQ